MLDGFSNYCHVCERFRALGVCPTLKASVPVPGSVTFAECTCGQRNAWQNSKRTGKLSRPGEVLVNLFKVMHEAHGGTVTVQSQNKEISGQ